MANWSGYAAIQAEARRLGWPTSYHDDLEKHDRDLLGKEDAPQMFGWSIYDTGTNFYHPNSLEAIYWARARSQSADVFYWYDGVQLMPISFDELLHQLIQTLDSTFYQQRLQVANTRVSQLWKAYFFTTDERNSYVTAEQERAHAERNHQKVVQLTGEKQEGGLCG